MQPEIEIRSLTPGIPNSPDIHCAIRGYENPQLTNSILASDGRRALGNSLSCPAHLFSATQKLLLDVAELLSGPRTPQTEVVEV